MQSESPRAAVEEEEEAYSPSAKSRNARAIAKRPAARGRLRALAIAVRPNTIGRAIYNRPHADAIPCSLSFALVAVCEGRAIQAA